MPFDYRKLRGRIIEKCGSQKEFAKKMNLSERTLTLKLSGKIEWKQSEILKSKKILDIKEEEITIFFFTLKVQ